MGVRPGSGLYCPSPSKGRSACSTSGQYGHNHQQYRHEHNCRASWPRPGVATAGVAASACNVACPPQQLNGAAELRYNRRHMPPKVRLHQSSIITHSTRITHLSHASHLVPAVHAALHVQHLVGPHHTLNHRAVRGLRYAAVQSSTCGRIVKPGTTVLTDELNAAQWYRSQHCWCMAHRGWWQICRRHTAAA